MEIKCACGPERVPKREIVGKPKVREISLRALKQGRRVVSGENRDYCRGISAGGGLQRRKRSYRKRGLERRIQIQGIPRERSKPHDSGGIATVIA